MQICNKNLSSCIIIVVINIVYNKISVLWFYIKLHTFVFLSLSVELSLEWLCMVELNGGDGIGEVPELVEVGVPPVSLLLLLSVVADEGIPTPDSSTSSRPIISS